MYVTKMFIQVKLLMMKAIYLTFCPLFDVKNVNVNNQPWSVKYNDSLEQNIKLPNIGDR